MVKLDLGLDRKMTASAASSGLPKRPRGMVAMSACSKPGATSVARRVIGVSVQVGHTEFTRIPRGALSRASRFLSESSTLVIKLQEYSPAVLVIAAMACLQVVYCLS